MAYTSGPGGGSGSRRGRGSIAPVRGRDWPWEVPFLAGQKKSATGPSYRVAVRIVQERRGSSRAKEVPLGNGRGGPLVSTINREVVSGEWWEKKS